jgi:hypothetical protein
MAAANPHNETIYLFCWQTNYFRTPKEVKSAHLNPVLFNIADLNLVLMVSLKDLIHLH